MNNFEFFMKLLIIGMSPWVLQSKKPTEFFRIEGVDFSLILNFFGSLFSSTLFLLLYSKGNKEVSTSSDIPLFFFVSLLLAVCYYLIQIKYYKGEGDRSLQDIKEEIQRLETKSENNSQLKRQLLALRNSVILSYGRMTLQFICYVGIYCFLALSLAGVKV